MEQINRIRVLVEGRNFSFEKSYNPQSFLRIPFLGEYIQLEKYGLVVDGEITEILHSPDDCELCMTVMCDYELGSDVWDSDKNEPVIANK
jgi:hypothetical protein